MQRVLDVVVAAVILAIPALALAKNGVNSRPSSASGHNYFTGIAPNSSSAPGAPGTL